MLALLIMTKNNNKKTLKCFQLDYKINDDISANIIPYNH